MSELQRNRKNSSKDRSWKLRMTLLIILGLIVIWLAAVLRFIVYPTALNTTPEVETVDAVYVLGIASEERLKKGIELVEQGVSDQLIVTVTAGNPLAQFCAEDHPFTVHCVTPDPIRTRGEARQWSELARSNHWDSVMVVTMRPHATRAQISFERCHEGQVLIADDEALSFSPPQWLQHSLYESAAFVKFSLERGC